MRKGFTFIEIAMVVPLFMVISLVMFQLFMVYTTEFQTAALQADVKSEMRHAAARIYGRAAASSPWKLDADNRGLRLKDGTRVRWEGDRLLLGRQSLLQRPVGLFLATVANQQLVLTLEVEAPNRVGGQRVRQRMVFEGEPR